MRAGAVVSMMAALMTHTSTSEHAIGGTPASRPDVPPHDYRTLPAAGQLLEILWTSNPVGNGETILVTHASASADNVTFRSSMDHDGGGHLSPGASLCLQQINGSKLCAFPTTVLHSDRYSTMVAVPSDWPLGVYQLSLAGSVTEVNVAEPWWLQADRGRVGSPGAGWLRVIGRALAFSATRCVPASAPVTDTRDITTELQLLDSSSAAAFEVPVVSASCYDLTAKIPHDLASGVYTARVRNRFAAAHSDAWSKVPGSILISPPPSVSDMQVSVRTSATLLHALDAARASSGGVITVPTGVTIDLTNEQTINMPNNTVLRGAAGPGQRPTLRWSSGAGAGSVQPLVSGSGTFELSNLHLLRVNMPNAAAVVSIDHGSHGARILNVNASSIRTRPYTEHQQVNWTLFVGRASGWIVQDSHFKQDGPILHTADGGALGPDPSPCQMGFPFRTVFHLEGATDGILLRNTFEMGCEGWSSFSTRRVIIENNTFRLTTPWQNVSEGGSITNAPAYPSTLHNAILRNYDLQSNEAYYRYETFTSDGGVGGYSGRAVRSQRARVTLAQELITRPDAWWPLPSHSLDDNWAGAAMVVLGGRGTGDVVGIAASKDHELQLLQPPAVPLDSTSEITVVPYAGQTILAGNTWINGTSVDYYGVALELVFADNTLVNMRSRPCPHCGDDQQLQDPIGGLCTHSLVYESGHDAPSMPNMRVEILGNKLINTNGIVVMAANCGMNSSVQVTSAVPTAPLTQGFVVRGNTLVRTLPCDFAPRLALFGHNDTRFYWDFTAQEECAPCKHGAAACADNGINVIGCVRGGVVEANVVGGKVNVNVTNGSRAVLAMRNS